MKKGSKENDTVEIGSYKWSRRELAQIIRRKMLAKSGDSKKRYNRKDKHKSGKGDEINL